MLPSRSLGESSTGCFKMLTSLIKLSDIEDQIGSLSDENVDRNVLRRTITVIHWRIYSKVIAPSFRLLTEEFFDNAY